jgi:hypothetical protein
LGHLEKEYDDLCIHLKDDFVFEDEFKTSYQYFSFPTHARRMAELKKCDYERDTLEWWLSLPPEARNVIYEQDNEEDWKSALIQVASVLKEADEIWTRHQFDIPVWEHWCMAHVYPSGTHYRKARDCAQMFELYPEIDRVKAAVPHNALFDCLSQGLQLERCLALHEHRKAIYSNTVPNNVYDSINGRSS